MPALVDGYENKVDHQKWTTSARSLQQKEPVKCASQDQRSQRDGLPSLFHRQKERQTIGQYFRQFHAGLPQTRTLILASAFVYREELRSSG
jgi:hypothetical protein